MTIPLTDAQKIKLLNGDDIFTIMQEVLLREEKIDQEKEHFWLIGLATSNRIQSIELISLGTVRMTSVEPMNVFRVAVLKGATKVIMVHNHPSGELESSDADLEVTDRLIQVGRILHIPVIEHMIISTKSYYSFVTAGLMDQLEKSIKYVPPYELVERIKAEEKRIRAEEKRIRSEAVKIASLKNMEKGITLGKKEGIKLGEEKGLQQGKYDMAKMMKEGNESIEKIMKYTGLSEAVIQKL